MSEWLLESVLKGHSADALCLASRDSLLLSGSADRTARIWDLRTSTTRAVQSMGKFKADAAAVCFSTASDYSVFVSAAETLYEWDFRMTKSKIVVLPKDAAQSRTFFGAEEINSIACDVFGNFLCVSDDVGRVQLLETKSMVELVDSTGKTIGFQHENVASACLFMAEDFKPDDPSVVFASGGLDSSIQLSSVFLPSEDEKEFSFDLLHQFSTVSTESASYNPPFVHSLSKSADSSMLAAALGNGELQIFIWESLPGAYKDDDSEELTEPAVLKLSGHKAAVSDVCFADSSTWVDGTSLLFSCASDRTMRMWNLALLDLCESEARVVSLGEVEKPNALCTARSNRVIVADTSGNMSILQLR